MQPNLQFNFAKTKRVGHRLAHSRSSVGMYRDEFGIWKTAPINSPRFHHDEAGECLGFLIENESRQNRALYCRDLTNAAWVKTSCSAVLTATGIDGTANSASTLTASGTNATAIQAITAASAQNITSAFIRRRTGNGTVEMTQDGGATWTPVTLSSSWQRFNLTAVTSANPSIGFRIQTSGDAIDVDYSQNEASTSHKDPSTPILTTSAAVTRSADTCSLSGAFFSDVFNQNEGTILCTYVMNALRQDSGTAYVVDINTSNNLIRLRVGNVIGGADLNITDNAVSTVDTNSFGNSSNLEYRSAIAYKLNDSTLAINGVALASDTTCNFPLTALPNSLFIGNSLFMGCVGRIALFPRRFANSTLITLTA